MSQYGVYLSYKQVQDGWLFKVPEHWEIKKLKYIAFVQPSNVDKKSVEDQSKITLCNYTDVYYNEVISPDMDFMNATATNEQISKFSLKSGDVIITKDSEDPRDIAVPAFVPESIPSVLCGYHLAVVRHKDSSDGEYIFRYFQSSISRGYFFCAAKGLTRFGIGIQAINELPVALPPKNEQKAIASCLDQETTHIDALIEKKQRLIELLQEKLQAIITQAVTKGLDPNAPMKDSWIGWLGEVPEDWSVPPVYANYEVQLGKMLDTKNIVGTLLAPYLRNTDVQWGKINTTDLPEMDFNPIDKKRYRLTVGDLLICEGGEAGRTAIWNGELEECYYQKALHRVRLLSRNGHPHYFYYLMIAAAKNKVFTADGNQTTIGHLTAEQFRKYRFPFPPIKEQEAISYYLNHEIYRMENLTGQIQQSVDLLHEKRSVLITAVVTGQIDVREEVA